MAHDDWKLDDAEDEFNEQRVKAVCLDAAVFVVGGIERGAAIQKAEAIFDAQQEAQSDVTGTAELADEAQSPAIPKDKKAQVAAIAKELEDNYY